MNLTALKASGMAPEWLTEEGWVTLSKGYLLPDETPRGMYRRVADSAAHHLGEPGMADVFYRYIDAGWLCLASPVASNAGTARGLPVSCFGQAPGDSLHEIFESYTESAMMAKHGGGVSKFWGLLRGRGDTIKGNGTSDGIIPWIKVEEAMLSSTSQGGVRRGSGVSSLPIESPDCEDFIDIRRKTGDPGRRCHTKSFHHAVCVSDAFMTKVLQGDLEARTLWRKVLETRLETGEPYITWTDTANAQAPQWYRDRGRTIKASNLCQEIMLTSDPEHSFVCCLSSLNLARYDEWKGTNVVQVAIKFLDGIMGEFIAKASGRPGFEKAVRFASASRALGLGVIGWHTLLQSRLLPFESFGAMSLNAEIWQWIRSQADYATQSLARHHGEPEWLKGYGVRNSHLLACAPTSSNALISGGVSQGIEPLMANVYFQDTAKGTFIRKNAQLEGILEALGRNTPATWNDINKDQGSVRGLSFLDDHTKEVFKTAREINQFAIVRQAAQRQVFIDQGQSVNLFFSKAETDEERLRLGRYINEVHLEAYALGLKSLYYVHASSALQGGRVPESTECKSCEA